MPIFTGTSFFADVDSSYIVYFNAVLQAKTIAIYFVGLKYAGLCNGILIVTLS